MMETKPKNKIKKCNPFVLGQHEEVAVKYRDLFEKFKQVLMAEMRKEQTEAPLVMALNAFRGFLDEFMKQHTGRGRREKKEERKPEKPNKRDKQKKDMVVSVAWPAFSCWAADWAISLQ